MKASEILSGAGTLAIIVATTWMAFHWWTPLGIVVIGVWLSVAGHVADGQGL